MKRILPLFMAALLTLSMVGCGGKEPEKEPEKKRSGITIEALETGLQDVFGDGFEHFEIKEADGGFTFSYGEDTYDCTGKADDEKNITAVSIITNNAKCDILSDKDAMLEVIDKMTNGRIGEVTLGEAKASKAYLAVMQLYIALGADMNVSAEKFSDETLSVLTDGTSLTVNGWAISASLDANADTAAITARFGE